MAKKTIDPDAIYRWDNTAYTAVGIAAMNDIHLLELHNKLAKYLGNEERTAFPSRKLLEKKTISYLHTAQHPDTKKAPESVKPVASKKAKTAKPAIPAGSGKDEVETKETDMGTNAKKSKNVAAAKGKGAKSTERRKGPKPERASSGAFAGKKLYSTSKDGTNPRREGSIGFKSHAIVLKNKGITYEDFIAKGGRSGDVRWDVEHGFMTAK